MKLFDRVINSKAFNMDMCRVALIILFAIIINITVYLSGGTKCAWAQLNYIPIILAAYHFKTRGGMIVALILGLIVGPFMPLDVDANIMQDTSNWILRLIIYLLFAYITGEIFRKNEKLTNKIKDRAQKSTFIDLYNTNKLFPELDEMLENKEEFYLIVIKIRNLEGIGKYVNHSIIKKTLYIIIDKIKESFVDIEVYYYNYNEYVFIVKDMSEFNIENKLNKLIENEFMTMKLNNYSFNLQVKCGIVFSGLKEQDIYDLFNKARIAIDQGGIFSSGVYFYDSKLEANNRLMYEITGSLEKAIANDELYLVYQPVIDIKNNKIASVEILLRWDRGDKTPVGPDVFIKVAERVGLIKEISKWVIKNAAMQITLWYEKGIDIKTTVNLTTQEILDDDFREWARQIIDENHIERKEMGIEITERVFSSEDTKLKMVLKEMQNKGYRILIDDVGTGYNSLMTIGQIPLDVIKIDKYFIDRINEVEINRIVKHLIDAVHEMDKTVVAEGVETKEQLEILEKFGCDKIQGYYFSKPLLPEDVEKYYYEFYDNLYMKGR